MNCDPLPRLDLKSDETRAALLPYCRLQPGEIWHDPQGRHTVGCGDATDMAFVRELVGSGRPCLAIHDPPYNLVMFERKSVDEFVAWCRRWVDLTWDLLTSDAALYVWLGADQNDHFQPLGQFMAMMAATGFKSRSLISMRNQRGYGTRKNWMAVRQELLYYTKGDPSFEVQYTDIPKILRGYYKEVNGELTENLERSRSRFIRPGNIWVDIQQVFYRMKQNVSGCYAQKPLKAIERIIEASSRSGESVIDLFAHAGTTLLACELIGRRCVTCDIDPVFAEISIRRLEQYRANGATGWQMSNPFAAEPAETEVCR